MCEECVRAINKEAKPIEAKLYRATKAYHLLGNISRDKGSICLVCKETQDYFIGNWDEGYGFIDVVFPKETTHEIEIPSEPIIVRTKNSVYRFGKADDKGKRNVSREGKPLDFSICKIERLVEGYPLWIDYFDPEYTWTTSSVKSIELIS